MNAFPLNAARISVETDAGPVGFHERLLTMIGQARDRISLASLYLGTGEQEAGLLRALRAALQRQSALRVRLIVDFSRGLRRTSNGNSRTFTQSLIHDFPDRFEVYFHRMPQLSGLASWLPSPLDECVAVFHFKALVVDDVAVLTGANLSEEYFRCRQCRAIVVRDDGVASFLHAVVETTARHSLRSRGATLDPPSLPTSRVGQAILADVAAASRDAAASQDMGGQDTWLTQLFQHPTLGIHQEREHLRTMFSRREGELMVHTPYTNVPEVYAEALQWRVSGAGVGQTMLVCPSGNSHSFTTGRGPKALVPGIYMQRERELVARLRAVGELTLRHYDRPGWVFHSKGVWSFDDVETATVIGSSSFGARSVARDFDLSCLIATQNPVLGEALRREPETILAHAATEKHVERIGSWLVPLLTPLATSFL